MRKLITFFCFCILLNACSVQKCRYSNGFKVNLSPFSKQEKAKEIHAAKAIKQQYTPQFTIIENIDTVFKAERLENITSQAKINHTSLNKHQKKEFNLPQYQEKKDNTVEKVAPSTFKNTNGRVKTIRTLFAILGIIALILALVFIVLAIAELSYTWLLAATASASLSFVMLYIGKRKLDLGIIELKKKWLKLLRDIAFILMSVTLAVWLVLKVFYG